MRKQTLSPVYIVQIAPETKSNYGEFEIFESLESLKGVVNDDPDRYMDRSAWIVNLNAVIRQTVKISDVSLTTNS